MLDQTIMRNDRNKIKLNEFINYFCGFYLLTVFWLLIIVILILFPIAFIHFYGHVGAIFLLFSVYGILFGLVAYLYYWIAKGLIIQKNIRAFLAIILINLPSYFSFKFNYNSIMVTIFNIMLSTLLLYSIIYSFREKKR